MVFENISLLLVW